MHGPCRSYVRPSRACESRAHVLSARRVLPHESRAAYMSVRLPLVLTLGDVQVVVQEGYTVTYFPEGKPIWAPHEDCGTGDQAATAADLGYADVVSMNREHDVVHTLLASWLGLREGSPTLRGLATEQPWPHAWGEEGGVLAVQRLTQVRGSGLGAGAQPDAGEVARTAGKVAWSS